MPAIQASTPGTNPSLPAAIRPPVAMQVRSSLMKVESAIRSNWPMEFPLSGGARQKLLLTRTRPAKRGRRIQKAHCVPANNHPTETDCLPLFPMHAGGVRVRGRAVACMKPVQEGRIEAFRPAYPTRELTQAGAANSGRVV